MVRANAGTSAHPDARRLSSVPAPPRLGGLGERPLSSSHDCMSAMRSDLRSMGAVQPETVLRAVRSEGHNFVAFAVSAAGDSRFSTCVFLSALSAFQDGRGQDASEAGRLAAALAKSATAAVTPAALMHASSEQTLSAIMGVPENRRDAACEILLSLHQAFRASVHDSTRLADALDNIGTHGDGNQKAAYARFCQERDRRFLVIDVHAEVA
jgi:hypothetical protein